MLDEQLQSEMMRIRYQSKKLPKTLVWPIQPNSISSALSGSPHFADLQLSFSDSPVFFKSEFQRLLRESLSYIVLKAEYRPASKPGYGGSNWMLAHGFYDATWTLQVNPVFHLLQTSVELLLQQQGLPAVADWLQSSTQIGWDLRYHRLECVFAPTLSTLTLQRIDGA